MNNTKAGSYGRLIAFFLVAIILLCAFGFAVEGWQPQDQTDHGANDSNTGGTNDDNKPANGDDEGGESEPEKPKIPDYTDSITGLETDEATSREKHLCFVMDSASPLYGISNAQMLIEIPTETNSTRILAFMKKSAVSGKLGSIAPTRGYISNLAKFFGSVLVSYGSDDTKSHSSCDLKGAHFSLSGKDGYSYTEFERYHYTNSDLLMAGLTNSGINTIVGATNAAPYKFVDFYAPAVSGAMSAKSLSVPFTPSSTTEFYYSVAQSAYLMSKNSNPQLDSLSPEAIKFNNVFVLFADSVTYEDEEGSELVMNTIGNGKGVYFTGGTAKNIKWSADPLGNMTFYDESDNQLSVNRGSVYIGFVKSANASSVKFS